MSDSVPPPLPLRTDIFVTVALRAKPPIEARARAIAEELNAPFIPRRDEGMHRLFAAYPDAERAVVVQSSRLLLVSRTGEELFYHPNTAFLRLGNLLRSGRDLLIEAGGIGPGDSVLDATLGHASEAILCAHVVGDTGEVHGIEAVPELGILLREGLPTVVTAHRQLNEAMRRVRVVHIGHHLDYLRVCPTGRYDVVCFDPFFDEILPRSETFAPLRLFGNHERLLPEAVAEARRVARRRIVIKSVRKPGALEEFGVSERYESRQGKVVYGVLPGGEW